MCIRDSKLTGKGRMAANVYPTSKKWQSYGKGANDIAKTDLLVGKKRISLKTGDARLMSGAVFGKIAGTSAARGNA